MFLTINKYGLNFQGGIMHSLSTTSKMYFGADHLDGPSEQTSHQNALQFATFFLEVLGQLRQWLPKIQDQSSEEYQTLARVVQNSLSLNERKCLSDFLQYLIGLTQNSIIGSPATTPNAIHQAESQPSSTSEPIGQSSLSSVTPQSLDLTTNDSQSILINTSVTQQSQNETNDNGNAGVDTIENDENPVFAINEADIEELAGLDENLKEHNTTQNDVSNSHLNFSTIIDDDIEGNYQQRAEIRKGSKEGPRMMMEMPGTPDTILPVNMDSEI